MSIYIFTNSLQIFIKYTELFWLWKYNFLSIIYWLKLKQKIIWNSKIFSGFDDKIIIIINHFSFLWCKFLVKYLFCLKMKKTKIIKTAFISFFIWRKLLARKIFIWKESFVLSELIFSHDVTSGASSFSSFNSTLPHKLGMVRLLRGERGGWVKHTRDAMQRMFFLRYNCKGDCNELVP